MDTRNGAGSSAGIILVPGGVLTDFSSAMKYVQLGPQAFAKPIKSSVSLRYGIALVAAPVIKLNREVCFGTTPEGLEVGVEGAFARASRHPALRAFRVPACRSAGARMGPGRWRPPSWTGRPRR